MESGGLEESSSFTVGSTKQTKFEATPANLQKTYHADPYSTCSLYFYLMIQVLTVEKGSNDRSSLWRVSLNKTTLVTCSQ